MSSVSDVNFHAQTDKVAKPKRVKTHPVGGYKATDISLKAKGPPKGYTPEAAQYVLDHITNGGHLSKLIEDGVITNNSNLRDWMKYDAELGSDLARAQEERAELWADQLIEIADDSESDPNDRRIRIDARWKVIGALLHRRYGVKQTIDVNANVNVAVEYASQLMRLADKGETAKVIEDISYTRKDKRK